MKVLNVGCGTVALDHQTLLYKDWEEVRTDSFENETIDQLSDITDLKEFEDESFDSVWACHVVEHNYFHDLPKVFGSIMRVLKKDGFAIIRVPDLGSIAHLIEEHLLDPLYESPGGTICPIDMIYSHRAQVANFPGMEHKTGFTKKSMGIILESLGINALINGFNYEVIAVLYKDKIPYDIVNKEGFII